MRHGEPDPIPAIQLAQLAVDQEFKGNGIGSGLLRDAFFRSQQVSEIVGARVLLLDAIDVEAKQFYLAKGFKQSPIDEMQLMHSLTF
jgi:GNAT superfamily N-acetyltransferase